MLVFLTWTTASIDLFAAKVRSGSVELLYLFWLKLAGIDMFEYLLSTISEINLESNLLSILLIANQEEKTQGHSLSGSVFI